MVLGYLLALGAGILGGRLVGVIWPRLAMEPTWASLGGLLGGGVAGLVLAVLGAGSLAPGFGLWSTPDLGLALANLLSGAVCGGAVIAPLGAVRSSFGPEPPRAAPAPPNPSPSQPAPPQSAPRTKRRRS